jgi:PAS domain-containing protein
MCAPEIRVAFCKTAPKRPLVRGKITRQIGIAMEITNSRPDLSAAMKRLFHRGILRLKFRIAAAQRFVRAHLKKAPGGITRFLKTAAEEPGKLREARSLKENHLRNLAAISSEPTVVTDGDQRLISANGKALELFGISQLNVRYFSVDAFLVHSEILDSAENDLPFLRRVERRGRCKIRRLDGELRVADCVLTANILPGRHLYRFLNTAPDKLTAFRPVALPARKRWPRAALPLKEYPEAAFKSRRTGAVEKPL